MSLNGDGMRQDKESGLVLPGHVVAGKKTAEEKKGFPLAPQMILVDKAHVRSMKYQGDPRAVIIFTIEGFDLAQYDPEKAGTPDDTRVLLAASGMVSYEDAIGFAKQLIAHANSIPVPFR